MYGDAIKTAGFIILLSFDIVYYFIETLYSVQSM